jgi:hypothetical protein
MPTTYVFDELLQLFACKSTVTFDTDAVYVRQDLQGTITWAEVDGKDVTVILKTSKATEFELTFWERKLSTYSGSSYWNDDIQVCSVEFLNNHQIKSATNYTPLLSFRDHSC